MHDVALRVTNLEDGISTFFVCLRCTRGSDCEVLFVLC
jgi:hypothetical protein